MHCPQIALSHWGIFFHFQQRSTSICICLWDKLVLVCDSFGVSDSRQAALHIVNKRRPSLLYSLTISCDRRHTCPRPNEQRRVKWPCGVDLPVPRWVDTSHPCPAVPPPVQTLTGGRHAHLSGWSHPGTSELRLRPSKVSISRQLARRSAGASYKTGKAPPPLSAGLQLVLGEYILAIFSAPERDSQIYSPVSLGSTSLVKLHPSAKPCQVIIYSQLKKKCPQL